MPNVILYQYGEKSSHPVTHQLYDPWTNHIWTSISQIRKWNPLINIYMITGDHDISETENFEKLNVIRYKTTELLTDYDIDKTEYAHDSQESRSWLERNFYIESLIRKLDLTDIFTFDNDVLIFEEFDKLAPICSRVFNNVSLTRESDRNVIFGMCYIKNLNAISQTNKHFWNLIQTPQGKNLMDMELWDVISRIYGKDLVDFLPTWPDSENFLPLDGIFDPISIGQFFNGTHHGGSGGLLQAHHHIHQKLSTGNWNFVYEYDNVGRKFYSVVDKNRTMKVKIFSIHVHSKKLLEII